MVDWLAPSFIYTLFKDAWRAFGGRTQHLSPEEILKKREHWRKLFNEEKWNNYNKKLSEDVIIHDVNRMDMYPHAANKGRRVSPWFKSALLDARNDGILVYLSAGSLARTNDDCGWRFIRPKEDGDIEVILAGIIPYEEIAHVDWRGDDYYNLPHIFCHYHQKGRRPCKERKFYQEREQQGRPPMYLEVADFLAVKRQSKKYAIHRFL